jgi:hypothetical protein
MLKDWAVLLQNQDRNMMATEKSLAFKAFSRPIVCPSLILILILIRFSVGLGLANINNASPRTTRHPSGTVAVA